MTDYPQELAQDAVCQSHTGHMSGLWFLPARPLRLITNDDDLMASCLFHLSMNIVDLQSSTAGRSSFSVINILVSKLMTRCIDTGFFIMNSSAVTYRLS